jgi:NADH:ubiquinone oxidoreductase subunit F (NADH-binding)
MRERNPIIVFDGSHSTVGCAFLQGCMSIVYTLIAFVCYFLGAKKIKMVSLDVIQQLKNSGLTGRGGAGFPTWKKWQIVHDEKKFPKYVICNVSEGEPGVHKDEYLLDHHIDEVLDGILAAGEYIQAERAYIYLRSDLFLRFKKNIESGSTRTPLVCVKEEGGYISGEESTLISVIEGSLAQPKIRPPFPTQKGLFGKPTLVNNCETFYVASKVLQKTYTHTRLYTISGNVAHEGVFERSDTETIADILKATGNMPDFDFFVQVGGGASGPILLSSELHVPVPGSGAIIVYDRKAVKPFELLNSWVDFFMQQNCDKCVPCREGLYRISEMIKKEKIDNDVLQDILFTLMSTSFCPLGRSVPVPIITFIEKILYAKNTAD